MVVFQPHVRDGIRHLLGASNFRFLWLLMVRWIPERSNRSGSNRMRPRQRTPVLIDRSLHLMTRRRTIKIVRHIIFPRPNQLHGLPDNLRDLCRLRRIIRHVAPPKSTTHEGCVNDDSLRLEIENLCDRSLHPVRRLRWRPHLSLTGSRMNRDVHRFHGGVREEWKFVRGLHALGSIRQYCFHVTIIADAFAGLCRPRMQRRMQGARRISGRRAIVPLDLQRFPALHGGPGGVCHHRDPARGEHVPPQRRYFEHLLHARHSLRLGRIEVRVFSPECWTPCHHRKQHLRHADIQPKHSAAVDL